MSFFKKILGDDEELENNLDEEEYDNSSDYADDDSVKEKISSVRKGNPNFVLVKPDKREELFSIADDLLRKKCVVLNLELVKSDTRRFVDFLSGVAYANGGKIKRVATSTFIITPYNVDLTGDDVLDELENNGVYF